ncbi:MAG TPA: hypothetical protein VJW51_07685 [Candidatus Acidoferrales bacterium]|nr:hypothetical protein [Candidatus Acidoferrales bacterium]
MTQQAKVRTLAGLALVLALIVFINFKGGGSAAPGTAPEETYRAIALENPALHLERIERLRKLEYHPTGRDIFTSELPKPPKPPTPQPTVVPGPPLPPPEPPLVVPFKFYGVTTDARTGKRRGLFTNGDEVFIVGEGESVQSRFRILTIGNTSAEVEEIGTSRRATLTMEAQSGGPQG